MRSPDLPGHGTRTDPEWIEERPCVRCKALVPFDLNGNRRVCICQECRADIQADRSDARRAQIELNRTRGA